jgi:citrate lyase beta subunit
VAAAESGFVRTPAIRPRQTSSATPLAHDVANANSLVEAFAAAGAPGFELRNEKMVDLPCHCAAPRVLALTKAGLEEKT